MIYIFVIFVLYLACGAEVARNYLIKTGKTDWLLILTWPKVLWKK